MDRPSHCLSAVCNGASLRGLSMLLADPPGLRISPLLHLSPQRAHLPHVPPEPTAYCLLLTIETGTYSIWLNYNYLIKILPHILQRLKNHLRQSSHLLRCLHQIRHHNGMHPSCMRCADSIIRILNHITLLRL